MVGEWWLVVAHGVPRFGLAIISLRVWSTRRALISSLCHRVSVILVLFSFKISSRVTEAISKARCARLIIHNSTYRHKLETE